MASIGAAVQIDCFHCGLSIRSLGRIIRKRQGQELDAAGAFRCNNGSVPGLIPFLPPGDEYRLRVLGRLPRRRALCDGNAGPRRARRHDREAKRKILSRPPQRRRAERAINANSTPCFPFTRLARQLRAAPSQAAKLAFFWTAINNQIAKDWAKRGFSCELWAAAVHSARNIGKTTARWLYGYRS